jgi:hypothetical protein
MTAPLIFYKPCSIGDTYFRECLPCGAIVKNEGLHTLYHEQQASPKRCPKCGLLDRPAYLPQIGLTTVSPHHRDRRVPGTESA